MTKLVILLAVPFLAMACSKDHSKTQPQSRGGDASSYTAAPDMQNHRSTVVAEEDIDLPITLQNISGVWKVTHVQTAGNKSRYSETVEGEAKNYEMIFSLSSNRLQLGHKLKGSDSYLSEKSFATQLTGNKLVTKDSVKEMNADYKVISLKKNKMRIQDLSKDDRVDYYLVRVN